MPRSAKYSETVTLPKGGPFRVMRGEAVVGTYDDILRAIAKMKGCGYPACVTYLDGELLAKMPTPVNRSKASLPSNGSYPESNHKA